MMTGELKSRIDAVRTTSGRAGSTGDGVDQSFHPPQSPTDSHVWPAPTPTAYPMKPSDSLLDDGRLFSGALGRVKAVQHEQRVILRWTDTGWVVARDRLAAPLSEAGQRHLGDDPGFHSVFDPEPEQWGFRGDPYVWVEMCERLEDLPVPPAHDDAIALLHDTFRVVVGVELDDPRERVHVERFDQRGMSGGWVDLNTWRNRLMPMLEARLLGPNPDRAVDR